MLDIIESEDLIAGARHRGEWLFGRLNELKQQYPLIKAVDGRGLLVYIEFSADEPDLAPWALQVFMENNILVNLASQRTNTLKITPTLEVSQESLETFLAVFEAVLQHSSEQEDDLA